MTESAICQPENTIPNYGAVIDRAIRQDTLRNLAIFLIDYEHVEGGDRRKLCASETALIQSVVEDFLTDDSSAEVGVVEVRGLCERLASYAAQEEMLPRLEEMRNDCFNALACVKALEARLARQRDANSIMHEHLVMLSEARKKRD